MEYADFTHTDEELKELKELMDELASLGVDTSYVIAKAILTDAQLRVVHSVVDVRDPETDPNAVLLNYVREVADEFGPELFVASSAEMEEGITRFSLETGINNLLYAVTDTDEIVAVVFSILRSKLGDMTIVDVAEGLIEGYNTQRGEQD